MERPERLIRRIAWLMAGMLAAMLVLVAMLSQKITEPIRVLREGVGFVSTGNLDHVMDIRTGDEIQELAEAFNKMTDDLKAYIINLQQVTIEKERVESDLRVAHKIQAGMLPRIFPPFPEIEHLDLYATMEPAREVGGDFFDFFVLEDHRLCFNIGDVSGKGVPAALFMVITMTILRNQATLNPSLEQVFQQTNAMLCGGNDETMFVTLFMAILDPKTGELEYISAGHNPPLLSVRGKDFEFLNVSPSLVMGGMEGYPYRASKIVMQPGDMLFLYTDGVTEAMNAGDELFGDNRTMQALNDLKGKPVRELIQGMREAIDSFTQGAPASDDITMLAVSLTGLSIHGVSPLVDVRKVAAVPPLPHIQQ
jgi:phosphoserine phosphatase RsbU/P